MAGATLFFATALFFAPAHPGPSGQDQAPTKEDKKGESKKADESKKDDKAGKADPKDVTAVKLTVEVKADGAPCADALVLVKHAGGIDRNSSTNSAGIAHFSQVPRGKITMQVIAAGFKPYTSEQDLSGAGAQVNVVVALVKQQ
jgi:hypothetical protein